MTTPDGTPAAGIAPDFDRTLDVRAMNCPLPILRTKAEFARMQVGQVLKVVFQQAEYVRELEMFARQTGNRVVRNGPEDDHHAAWIQKA
ncbi:MAG: sulfurtransferase TusA family protein [Gammaproteobacteria bacterium]|nr:sulfurtransferase TusA family protein [Gammaproteobacteria bacterium]